MSTTNRSTAALFTNAVGFIFTEEERHGKRLQDLHIFKL